MAEQVNVPIPQALYRRIRELARMRKQPVDNVLAEVLDQALPPGNELDNTAEDTAVEREMQAYISLHPTLKEKYLGQHVAIFGGQLIDVDEDYGALYERIDAQYPDQFVWLATVEEEQLGPLTQAHLEVIGDTQNDEVIVGRDVLNHLTVTLDGPASSVEIADDTNPRR